MPWCFFKHAESLGPDIGDAAGLPNLIEALRERQYGEKLIAKIAHENWLGVLERTWG